MQAVTLPPMKKGQKETEVVPRAWLQADLGDILQVQRHSAISLDDQPFSA